MGINSFGVCVLGFRSEKECVACVANSKGFGFDDCSSDSTLDFAWRRIRSVGDSLGNSCVDSSLSHSGGDRSWTGAGRSNRDGGGTAIHLWGDSGGYATRGLKLKRQSGCEGNNNLI
jgi:hypothetical protein